MRQGTRRLAMACGLGLLAVAGAFGAASCSLSLDESLLGPTEDGGGQPVDDPDVGDSAAVDASEAAAPPALPDAAAECTTDEACKTEHGCVTGKCDLARNTCVYDVCRPAACKAATCDTSAGVCQDEREYRYKAAQFVVDAPLSCERCAAAVHPWLFVATAGGVLAFDVSNPASSTPRQVPVVGLGFVPSQLMKSGDRVWMVGSHSAGSPSRLPIAYIDPPADPFAQQITAKTALTTYDRSPTEALVSFPRTGDSLLLVGVSSARPAVFLEAPIVEPAVLTPIPLPYPMGTTPMAVSGTRLVMYAMAGGQASLTLIEGAGSASATMGATTTLTAPPRVSAARAFAQSDDGALFWGAGGLDTDPDYGDYTRAARGYFLTSGGEAPIEDGEGIDIEVYNPLSLSSGAGIFGRGVGAAMLDGDTAMVATMARENTAQTAVNFVRRTPLEVIKEADGTTPRRYVVPTSINNVLAATASNGIGYLAVNEASNAIVYVFDPACPR